MRKQMSCRLQELNSARWQLEPSAHDHFKFLPDYQLQQTLPIFGDVTDVFTHPGSSTVTMGHGSEGVMYNTLNGQLIEFFITAKDWNGRKRREGGDVFEVEISTQEGEVVFNNPVVDCGNGTYSFCFTPIHGVMEYQLSVKLGGCHVKGSPFARFNEIWNLCTKEHDVYQYPHDRHSCYIQFTENNMKATIKQRIQQVRTQQEQLEDLENNMKAIKQQHVQQVRTQREHLEDYKNNMKAIKQQRFQQLRTQREHLEDYKNNMKAIKQQRFQQLRTHREQFEDFRNMLKAVNKCKQQRIQQVRTQREQLKDSLPTERHNVKSPNRRQQQEVYNSGSKMIILGSSHFGSGKHSWKVCISGKFTAGFAFGVGVRPQDLCTGDSQWTWSSGHKYEHLLPLQESTITNCMNNDVIEFYLDCDNETLMMFNERTRQLDTWRRIQGEVHPLFELNRIGDQVTLPCQPNSSSNETFAEREVQDQEQW